MVLNVPERIQLASNTLLGKIPNMFERLVTQKQKGQLFITPKQTQAACRNATYSILISVFSVSVTIHFTSVA